MVCKFCFVARFFKKNLSFLLSYSYHLFNIIINCFEPASLFYLERHIGRGL